jgi:hypothetical protein
MRWFLLLILAFSLSACDDDDPGSGAGDPWVEQSLPAELVNGGIWGLDVGSDRAVALAVTGDGSFVIEEGPDGWVVVGEGALPGTMPVAPSSESSRIASGITVDTGGKIQVVGAIVAEMKPVIWSESDGSWIQEEIDGSGYLQDVVPLGSRDVLAAGTGSTGIPFVTGSAGTAFVFDTEPFGGEAGLTALVEESGAIYGCGFNDGGDGTGQDPWRIVMKYDLGEWSNVPSPCGACGSYDLRAIDATPDALYVGGSERSIRTGDEPYGNGTSIETAWLVQWSFEESGWAQLLLPDAELLQRVNAILVASDGVTYLACGTPETPAYLVRVEPGAAPVVEQEFVGTRLFSLAETPDGRILAAGLEPGEVEGRPVLLER